MGNTYTRASSYSDGDVITADHSNAEFNRLENDEEGSGILADPTTFLPQTLVNNQIRPLTIFDNQIAPMGVKPSRGIIEALTSATTPEIATDFVNQLETGEPITNDEQMFIDNEIANLRFP